VPVPAAASNTAAPGTVSCDTAPKPATTRTRTRSAARAARSVLITLAVVSIAAQSAVIASTGWAAANPRIITDTVTVWQFDSTPAVSGYATRAAMSERGRFLFYASTPRVLAGGAFDALCSREQADVGVLGCYTLADKRIYLYDIANPDLADFEVVVAAHEMLHAAWDRYTADERQAVGVLLEQAFTAVDPASELALRVASYEEYDASSRIPELYAILGTELAEIPDELELHYAEYFDDRSVVVSLWRQVESIFDELDQELERLSTELNTLAATITTERASLEQIAVALKVDIDAFTRPGAYSSASQAEPDRLLLVDRQTAVTAAIAATNVLVDNYNALREQFTVLNDEAQALNRDLNINPQPIDDVTPAP
jgi:hypothetical protein